MSHTILKTLLAVLCAAILLLGSYDLAAESQDQVPAPPPKYRVRAFKTPPQPVKSEEYCLTEAIYYEAGNQDAAGKEAVAIVVVNRMTHGRYPNTICAVVSQAFVVKNQRVCQFSYNCFKKSAPNKKWWRESNEIAKRVLQNKWNYAILSEIGDAIYYHASYVKPQWRKQKVFVGKIGDHLFYKDRSNV